MCCLCPHERLGSMKRNGKSGDKEVEKLKARVAELEQAHLQYKQIEAALRESEQKYRTFVQTIPDIVYTIDENGIFTFVSDYIEQLGYRPEELIGKHFSVILHQDDVTQVSRSSVLKKYKGKMTGDKNAPRLFDERRTRSRKTSNLEVRLLQKDREATRNVLIDVVTEVSASGFYSAEVDEGDKKFIGTIGVIRDITERKKQEEALRESEEKLKGILDAIADYICMVDRDMKIIWANEPFKKSFGISTMARSFKKIFGGREQPRLDIPLKAFSDGNVHEQDTRVTDKDGAVLYFHCTSNVALKDKRGNPVTVIVILRDVTAYRLAEEARRASQEFAGNIIDSSIDMIIAVGRERNIIEFNKAAQEAFGYTSEEILGKDIRILYADEEEGVTINEEVRARGLIRKEVQYRRKNNAIFPALISSSVLLDANEAFVGVMAISRDITELKKMEEELLKAQKLESIGILAGGIAHDFNNILTAVMGNISLAMYAKSSDEIQKRLKETEKAAIRAKELTYQLLTFSKGGAPIKRTASIVDIIKDSAGFASRGTNVRCEFSLPDDMWPVEVDEGQMSQVINNLIINALQAMPSGGVIHVNGENISLEEQSALSLNEGKYVKISVKDRGIGIPEEHLTKIFDPYFTTKQMGSGLGLATSYSIIKNHEGTITVESELGVGTCFYIYLPASPKLASRKIDGGEGVLAGKGRVLIMDDEDAIRDILGEMLAQLGYQAGYARDGDEAIALYMNEKDADRPFDAIIMDLTVPGGMGGKECIQKLRELDPGVKAIVSSGYSNDPVMANFRNFGFRGFVTKPYRLDELSEALHKAL
jgi:PAS domain S-box-containing protein